MLLDPTYGVPAVTEAQALAPSCGLPWLPNRPAETATTANPAPGATQNSTRAGSPRRAGRREGLVQLRADRSVPRRQVSPISRVRYWMSARKSSRIAHPQACHLLSRTLSTNSLASSSPARPARTRSSTPPSHSTSSTSTSSNSNTPGHLTGAAAWRTFCIGHGLCYRPECLSHSSVTSSRLRSTKGEPPGSLPAGQSGERLFPLEAWNVNTSWTRSLALVWTTLWPWPTSALAPGPRPPGDRRMSVTATDSTKRARVGSSARSVPAVFAAI